MLARIRNWPKAITLAAAGILFLWLMIVGLSYLAYVLGLW